jgi:hypothetical protein
MITSLILKRTTIKKTGKGTIFTLHPSLSPRGHKVVWVVGLLAGRDAVGRGRTQGKGLHATSVVLEHPNYARNIGFEAHP